MPRLSKIGAAALAAFGWTGLSSVSASYLVVAGGGGAGSFGGGGAGGFLTGTTSLNPTQSYTVTVGAGGAGVVSGASGGGANGVNGSNSQFGTLTASVGGGAGGGYITNINGSTGGSGGGGGYFGTAGAATSGQGNAGGVGNIGGAGGGGANAVGSNGGGSGSAGVGGAGGNGLANPITGSTTGELVSGTYYLAGGGGGGNGDARTGGSGGAGGDGGGGDGSTGILTTGTAGTANTGGGGGGGGSGSSTNYGGGGQGGSGVVIISYVGAQQFGGGVVTSSGGNTIHTFNTSGTLSPLSSLTASYLIVAGGAGGGADCGGGGGAGGMQTGSGVTIDTNSIYVVAVGAGGAGAPTFGLAGSNGVNSSFSAYGTASVGGGGGGGRDNNNAAIGGSGGGGSGTNGNPGAAGTSGQGNAGGNGFSSSVGAGGGGGGAFATGSVGGSGNGGNGGNGISNSTSGSAVTYAGGGGGGEGSTSGTGGTGGTGGGGNGASGGTSGSIGFAGTANLGGGGGGGGRAAAPGSGGAGGSGIVIISYAGSTQQMAGGTVTVAGGNVIHTFTSSGYLAPIFNANNSLRFRSSASAYLNRTPASATNRTTWTYSYWFKGINTTGSVDYWALSAFSDGNNYTAIRHRNPSDIDVLSFNGGSAVSNVKTAALFRDPAAWYHMVIVFDTSNATQADRIQIYQNGVRCPVQSSPTYPGSGSPTGWVNSTAIHYIGTQSTEYFDGYMAEINLIDGQALTPNSFGYYSDLGVWQPIRYGGSYGTNGFYLPFTNTTSTTTLGYDFSPNGNNWTTNNISLTSGSTYDSMTDVPTLTSATVANYAVMNPLTPVKSTLLDGNLRTNGGDRYSIATIGMSSGKWYAEMTVTTAGTESSCGIATQPDVVGAYVGNNANSWGYYNSTGDKYTNTTPTAYGATYTTGDVIGIAFDADAGTLTFYKNNTSQGTAFTGLTSGPYYFAMSGRTSGTANNCSINFGQQPFAYTPPTGFVRLNTFNLTTPTIGATAATTANKYMNVVTWTGNGTSSGRSITGVGFQPDFVWGKARSVAYGNGLYDAVRGTGKLLVSNNTNSEATNFLYGYLSSFDSDGFSTTAGSSSNENWNQTNDTYVAWNWKANGAGSTNTAGSITSTVSASTTAGFSIVTYTGNGSSGTVGHGLLVGGVATAPSMIIVKSRSTAQRWTVFHTSTSNAYIYLNENFAADTTNANVRFGNNTVVVQPTSTVFSIGNSVDVNQNTTTYVAYCFAQIAGYSAFGSYTGNGSTDGPFIFTGFRPRFVLLKSSTQATDWYIYDTARDTYNVATLELNPNLAAAEQNGTYGSMDINSNGFKLRFAGGEVNVSSQTYIYMAFAENPFKYANARQEQ